MSCLLNLAVHFGVMPFFARHQTLSTSSKETGTIDTIRGPSGESAVNSIGKFKQGGLFSLRC